MVRLQDAVSVPFALSTNGFNSKMVRLQDLQGEASPALLFRFNSKMVRLQDPSTFDNSRRRPVSIPKWCDCKL